MKNFQIAKSEPRTQYRPATVKIVELRTQGLICQSQGNGTLDGGMTRTDGTWEE